MPETPHQRHAFVLRIWQEEGIPWRGWVQHASSQEQAYVQSVLEIVGFIVQHTQGLVGQIEENEESRSEKQAQQGGLK